MAANKVYTSFQEAVADIPDGATIMIGGFGMPGDQPENLVTALRNHGAKNLTIIANTTGHGVMHEVNLGLIENKQVKKFLCSVTFPRTAAEKANLAGELEIDLIPQGTLAERIRAGGFGISGFYTRTGSGTLVEQGKEKKTIGEHTYLLELPLRADYALIRAYKADTRGNLVYRGVMRSFNAVMAPAADITIVEVSQIVELGELDPEIVITPGIFIDRILQIPEAK